MNADDANRLQCSQNDIVSVPLNGTSLQLPVRIANGLPVGLVGLPCGFPGLPYVDLSSPLKVRKITEPQTIK
jgi:hypothetical protein